MAWDIFLSLVLLRIQHCVDASPNWTLILTSPLYNAIISTLRIFDYFIPDFSDIMTHQCIFFAQGKCRNRSSCVFMHSTGVSQTPSPSIIRTIANHPRPPDRNPVHTRRGSNPGVSPGNLRSGSFNGRPQKRRFSSRYPPSQDSLPVVSVAPSR